MLIGVDACCWANKRGFGRFTRELLTAIVEQDKKNQYLFFVDQDTAAASQFPEPAKIVVAATRQSPLEAASAEGRRSLKDVWALTQAVRKQPVEMFFFPAVFSYFPILNRTKVLVTIHDVIADHHPETVFTSQKLKLFWQAKERLAVRQADLILTVSEYSKEQIVEYFKLPESRVRAITEGPSRIFNAVPRSQIGEVILRRYGLAADSRWLLYVGGISPHKNLQRLVEALRQLGESPQFVDVKLVLVGDYQNDTFHSDYPALTAHIERLQLTDKVIFTGFVKDEELVYLYNAASIFVMPSLEEGFGLPAIEAMACGAPVVVSNRGSLPEIVGDAGRFFNPYDAGDICKAIQEVLADAALKTRMREAGKRRAAQFTWEAAAAKTLAVFAEFAR